MNERQQLFLEGYLLSSNATESAKQAGYSRLTAYSQGSRLLKHPEVAAAIEERRRAFEAATLLTVQDVTAGLLHEALTSPNGTARVEAWGLIAKHYGMFDEQRQKPEPHLDLSGIPAEERQRLLGMRRRPPPLEG